VTASGRALAELAGTAAALAEFPALDDRDEAVFAYPPRARQLETALHAQFADFVEAWLREQGSSGAADEIRSSLAGELVSAGLLFDGRDLDAPFERASPWFGTVLSLEVERPPGDPTLLAVRWVVSLGVVDDASLVVFTHDGGRVRRVLEWSAELALTLNASEERLEGWFEDARSGVNNLHVVVPPRGPRGDARVILAWSQPGAPSSWGEVWWEILASGDSPRSPRVLEHGRSSAYQCNEECFVLALEDDEVVLDFDGNAGATGIASGFTTRSDRHRWRFTRDGVEALGGPTEEPFGFVDAWIWAKWSEARALGASTPSLRRWHEVLRGLALEGRLELADQMWDVCPCEEASHRVIALDLMPANEPTATLFFLMERVDDVLRMVGVSTSRPDAERWAPLRDCPEIEDLPSLEPPV
jgi:hypothetical protein